MISQKVTYDSAVRTFDHFHLAALPSYHRFRQALSDLANEVPGDLQLGDFLTVVRDAALTAPYGDCCGTCPDRHVMWPSAGQREGDLIKGHYRCPHCHSEWTCNYAVDLPHFI